MSKKKDMNKTTKENKNVEKNLEKNKIIDEALEEKIKQHSKYGFGVAMLFVFIIAISTVSAVIYIANEGGFSKPRVEVLESVESDRLVGTMLDDIKEDSGWCATLQLVWNGMMEEFEKGEIILDTELDIVDNLNKKQFNKEMISDDYYYVRWGEKTNELKEQIEQGLKEKFNQKSDIIEDIKWSDTPTKEMIFYSMLYRKFEYEYKFAELERGTFGKFEEVRFFGLDDTSEIGAREQIEVLYYNSDDDFAIALNTKSNDEVILCKGAKGKNFKEIYDKLTGQKEQFKGDKTLGDIDTFKMPYIKVNEKKQYKEFVGKRIEGTDYEIDNVIQTLAFELNEKGGEVKSEAATETLTSSKPNGEPRHFEIDDSFTLFLKEEKQELPYMAMNITDIELYQER